MIIELHMEQTIPFNNINRGEFGAPKSCVYGGYPRARISSQSQKRAIREDMALREKKLFNGVRTRHISDRMFKELLDQEIEEKKALVIARAIGEHLGKDDNEEGEENSNKTKTVLFFSPGECHKIAKAVAEQLNNEDAPKILAEKNDGYILKKGAIAKILSKVPVMDNADIAIFGRMVATDPTLNVEGAASLAHAISIHKAANEVDFFSTMNEDKDPNDSGAGFAGENMYNSATYYRYICLDLGILKKNLMGMNGKQKKFVVESFLRSCLRALPKAKKNSAFAMTYPKYVLGVVRDKGTPLSMGDVFEEPVRSSYIETGWDRLANHWTQLKQQLGSEIGNIRSEVTFSTDPKKGVGVDDFCKEILKHV